MVELLQPPVSARRHPNLILHCGASSKSRNVIKRVPTPKGTATWSPIPHILLIEEVERALKANGLKIASQAHSLTHDQSRYFGLMEVQNGEAHEDYAYVLGLRNSHDKRFPAGLVAGATVFVCDNLSFSGEIKIARKHTRFILRDIPSLTQDAIGRLMQRWHHQDERIVAYKGKNVTDRVAHDLIIRSTDVGAATPRQIPSILKEWRDPKYQEFQTRNVWSLFNAFTEVAKGNLIELPRRTERLHGLMDSFVGLN